jgi:hypothetical protein
MAASAGDETALKRWQSNTFNITRLTPHYFENSNRKL